jgi:hypothetical protein
MARDGCIFCGAKPTTQEHIISRWCYEIMCEDPRGIPAQGKHVRWNSAGVMQSWESAKPEFIANCVCGGCNCGWMNDIEQAARPALSAMIRDEPITLDRLTQNTVATWLGLKAIVCQYGQSPPQPVRREWLAELFESRRPPSTWQVRLSRYVGNHPARVATGTGVYHARHTLSPFPIQQPVLVCGIAVGYFFGQVVGIASQTVIPTPNGLFMQIWPHPLLRLDKTNVANDELVAWPPQRWLNDSDVVNYSRNITDGST